MVVDTESDYSLLMVIIISSLTYHFVVYTSAVEDFIRMAGSGAVSHGDLVSIGQPDVPLLTSILNSSKWGLFILAAISILWIIKTKNTNEFRLAVFFICIVFAGVIGNYAIASPLDRLIGFYVTFAAVFGSLTLFRFRDEWFRGIQKNKKVILALLIASILITAGFFGSQTPAYFFQDSEINTYYWYSNTLPPTTEYKAAGNFINKTLNKTSFYYVNGDCLEIPFYFAGVSGQNFLYTEKIVNKASIIKDVESSDNKFVIIYIYSKESLDRDHYTSLNKIYTTNQVKLFT
jgi:hypothetical protein